MRRTIGGALVVLAALTMPSVADVPAEPVNVASQAAAAEPCPSPAESDAIRASQVAVASDCKDCAPVPACRDCTVAAVAIDRPVTRPHYSPIGQAVLELLRSQGGGHLRP